MWGMNTAKHKKTIRSPDELGAESPHGRRHKSSGKVLTRVVNQQQQEIQIVHAKQFAADADLSGLTGRFEPAVHRPRVVQNDDDDDDDDDGGGG